MIICHCEVVSDREVQAAICGGAVCPDEIARRCGAGTHCGGCRSTIEELLADLPAASHQQTAA